MRISLYGITKEDQTAYTQTSNQVTVSINNNESKELPQEHQSGSPDDEYPEIIIVEYLSVKHEKPCLEPIKPRRSKSFVKLNKVKQS